MLLVSNLNKDKNTLGHSTRSLLHMNAITNVELLVDPHNKLYTMRPDHSSSNCSLGPLRRDSTEASAEPLPLRALGNVTARLDVLQIL